jgi:glutamyl-Q tRNA(Asp) synthetase
LHLGSLLAAVGSSLDAHRGTCLLRIDDLDPDRCRIEHERSILTTLDRFGLRYPRPIQRQSERTDVYAAALIRLGEKIPLFHCDCTRRELSTEGEPCCVKDCRQRRCDPSTSSLRADLSVLPGMSVVDRSLGEVSFQPQKHRDVIVRRRDGTHAYHLATVIDDTDLGVTDVVRGADLLPSTAWQLALHQALGLSPPRYLHLPVVTEPDGSKLAKSRRSAPLDHDGTAAQLRQVFRWLKQETPPPELKSAEDLLAWMPKKWDPARFAGSECVTVDA